MHFKYTEEDGEELPYMWIAEQVKELAKSKYGLDVKVEINPKYLVDTPEK